MTYTYETHRDSPNFTPASRCPAVFGRSRVVESITIHWWGDPNTRPTHDGVVNYLCRTGGTSSAHDVISDGRVTCIVDPDDAAWHAGDSEGNARSIGLELDPRADDGTYATAAERIAKYRAVYGDVPLRPHSSWKATACPGVYDLDRLDRLARTQEDDMKLTHDDVQRIAAGVWNHQLEHWNSRGAIPEGETRSTSWIAKRTLGNAVEARVDTAALAAAVETLAAVVGTDAGDVLDVVRAEVRRRLEALQIDVTVEDR